MLIIDHVQISIPKNSEPQARQFYCQLLGFTEIEKPDNLKAGGGLWLEAGTQQIHLGAEDFEHRANTKAHLAYRVENLVSWRRKLQQAHIEFSAPVNIKNLDRIHFRDPFGNRIELLEYL
ncbi:VOC family protein [Catenovulum adriaticum]|uniref:VOC family protein n=1 Tax=Catenovulum adriaticum TaxID=2984846 RepID=A0ABY7ALI7_9ALTE|nr:VOC family protein [Catenovulum sp. TS8]WAJ70413.1 VOC family protein [Catenovulum sp. TS8]